MSNNLENLQIHIDDHELVGASKASLGIRKMPSGYALMLNNDRTHFYWLRYDGAESSLCGDKWEVYRGAKSNLSWNSINQSR